MTISASEARQRLFPLLEQVNTDHEPVRSNPRLEMRCSCRPTTTTHGKKRSTYCVHPRMHADSWRQSPRQGQPPRTDRVHQVDR